MVFLFLGYLVFLMSVSFYIKQIRLRECLYSDMPFSSDGRPVCQRRHDQTITSTLVSLQHIFLRKYFNRRILPQIGMVVAYAGKYGG